MVGIESWSTGPEYPVLDKDSVHVWAVWLDQPPPVVAALGRLLANDERERAGRFHFEHHRARYTIGRGVLRALIARYTGAAPQSAVLAYGAQGKPFLAQPRVDPALQFNLAHSHSLAVYAFTSGRAVGIDVEKVRPMPDAEAIAQRFFSIPERDNLELLPASRREQAFFHCWTHKEAFIKLLGSGLTHPLDRFSVSGSGEPSRLLWVDGIDKAETRWELAALSLGVEYAGALAVEGTGVCLSCWQFDTVSAYSAVQSSISIE
jgi:4'-phosphopantetheinyl transferase